jgi:SecD/SecF fusion protein
MRNKTTIVVLLAIFSLICVVNIIFSIDFFRMDSSLKKLTEAERSERLADADFNKHYKLAQRNSFSLGLDLQGGMFVMLEVGVEDLVANMANENKNDGTFDAAMKKAKERHTTSQQSFVNLFAEEMVAAKPDVRLATYFNAPSSPINVNSTNDEVIDYLNKESKDAIDRCFEILRTRVDGFGVTSPTLQKLSNSGRIILELPGVKEPERVRNLLRGTARLEFWETHEFNYGWKTLENINKVVQRMEGIKVGQDSTAADSNAVAVTDSANAGNSPVAVGDTVKKDTTDAGVTSIADVNQDTLPGEDSTDVAANDSLSQEERYEKFRKENPFLGLITIPNVQGINPKHPLMGYVQEKDTAKLGIYLRDSAVQKILPSDVRYLFSAKPSELFKEEAGKYFDLVAIKYNKAGIPSLEGTVVVEARQDFDNQNPIVSMRMNAEGSQKWSNLTATNVDHCIAIVLDNKVQSYPNVQGRITGGNSQISGNFEVDEAKDLANLLKSGKLPVSASIIGDNEIGPSLGAANLSKGLMSFAIALIVIIAFMAVYYRSSGMVANVALIVNLIFILGISAAFNIVFTLPGIAALIFPIGAAVDANVLVFERVREELSHGKSTKAAVQAGFKNALSSILDSQITSFLTGVILYAFGTGPIRGFAVFLMIGIVTSLIAALFLTRIFVEFFTDRNKKLSFGSERASRWFANVDIKMSKRRRGFYIFSGVLTVVSLVSFFAFGFRQGVDFKGGYQYTISFNQSVDAESCREPLTTAFEGLVPQIKTVGGDTALMITTSYHIENADDPAVVKDVEDRLMKTLQSVYPNTAPARSSFNQVNATVADDIKTSAIYSVIASLIVIFFYIFVRFRRWQFGLGALIALFHDTIITCGVFSLLGHFDFLPFSLEIDQAFIAAILTIIGFSINDTVVVFDRIRERMREHRSVQITETFDKAINETLSRTLITSGTVILTVLVLLIFGGEVIRPFAFALFIGIAFGTYSSVFVASAISHDLLRRKGATTLSAEPTVEKATV